MFRHATQTGFRSFVMPAGSTASNFITHISAACSLRYILSFRIHMNMKCIAYQIMAFITKIVNAVFWMAGKSSRYNSPSLLKSLVWLFINMAVLLLCFLSNQFRIVMAVRSVKTVQTEVCLKPTLVEVSRHIFKITQCSGCIIGCLWCSFSTAAKSFRQPWLNLKVSQRFEKLSSY